MKKFFMPFIAILMAFCAMMSSNENQPKRRLQGPSGCEYVFKDNKEIAIEKKGKIIAYVCGGCGEWFCKKKDLKLHQKKNCPYFSNSKKHREQIARQELAPDYGH